MARPLVLVVDDEPEIRSTISEILQDEGYRVRVAEHAGAARAALRGERPDLVLLDVWMPDVDGISLLREWQGQGGLDAPVVMMSGHGTIETAVEATRLGAYDFIEKPISLAKLLLTLERALENHRLKTENQGLKRRLPEQSALIGGSAAIGELLRQAERAAQVDAWILIEGEPGTGKAELARWIHAKSARRDGPFVEVRAGSIAREQAALELFGAEHDGTPRYGLIERAQGGTLFLDEFADLDAELQLRLAAALHQRAVLRLGGTAPVPVDLRAIAATRRKVDEVLAAGTLREDLLLLLRVLVLRIPPLRERVEDIPELLRHYSELYSTRDRLPYRRFSIAAQNRLRQHPWPGNQRELANLVQRVLIMGQGDEVELAEVEAALGGAAPKTVGAVGTGGLAVDLNLPLREAREAFEREYLLHQLKLAGGSVGKLAKVVGMERTHLYRKLRALGLELREGGEG